MTKVVNPLSPNPTKWSNTLKTIRRLLTMNCFIVFEYFVGLALKSFMTEVVII